MVRNHRRFWIKSLHERVYFVLWLRTMKALSTITSIILVSLAFSAIGTADDFFERSQKQFEESNRRNREANEQRQRDLEKWQQEQQQERRERELERRAEEAERRAEDAERQREWSR